MAAIAVGAAWAAFHQWSYRHSPEYAVQELLRAYADRNEARALPFLTARGRALFEAGLDDEVYGPVSVTKIQAGQREKAAAVFHFDGLTRFGSVDADLDLVKKSRRWQLDEIYLHTAGGFPIDAAGSTLLPGGSGVLDGVYPLTVPHLVKVTNGVTVKHENSRSG